MFASLDYEIVRWATDLVAGRPIPSALVYVGAELVIYLFPLVLFLMWERPEAASKKHGTQKAVVLAVFTLVLSLAIKSAIEFLIIRDRPFVTHPDLSVLSLHVDASNSFPSGHTLTAFAIASSIWFSGFRKLGGTLLVLATIVGVSRVFSGVHYPSDVLAGAAIAILVAWVLHREGSALKRYLPNQ
jgi:undecaprenyl-diphosphatase